ncbi:helix-turn-helix transcriptional regulator [Adlercreutzia equolifaciens]|uniref:Helix-turn-helix transcriptional regulator n=2 Tax=Eggerthellaceae TaxID=1643826 RepID=A0A6L8Q6G2_9ACTN|nr:helix-turn-helix transcriptional regulator [Adlercreutzia equolifaciens]
MRLSGGFGAEAVAFVETALGIIVWTGIIVVALDLATYAEVPFSTIMGGVYLLLTGPAALIYLMSLAAPSLPTMLSSSLADAAIICLLVFCGLYLLNEQSLDDLFWGAHDAEGTNRNEDDASPATAREEAAPTPLAPDSTTSPSAASSEQEAADTIARLAAEAQLTAREHEVLGLLAEGRSAPFIAEYLSIERSTAKTHVARIYAKLGVHTRQELISLVLSAKGLGSAER